MNTTLMHYEFKEEKDGELLTPWTDPKLYEDPFDYHFLTTEEAMEMKKEHAPGEKWVLVKVTTEVLKIDTTFPECDVCDDEGVIGCGACASTGEGQWGEVRCFVCKGRGEKPCSCARNDDDYDAVYESFSMWRHNIIP